MLEHLLLFDKGVPTGSFSLVFDGNPVPERSSEIFQSVKLAAAWQAAWYQHLRERKEEHDSWKVGMGPCYYSMAFPQAINSMIEGRSSISCNFFLGDLLDTNEVLEQNRDLTDSEWDDKYSEEEERCFQTSPPLPPWTDLRLEDVIPEE